MQAIRRRHEPAHPENSTDVFGTAALPQRAGMEVLLYTAKAGWPPAGQTGGSSTAQTERLVRWKHRQYVRDSLIIDDHAALFLPMAEPRHHSWTRRQHASEELAHPAFGGDGSWAVPSGPIRAGHGPLF